MDATEQIDPHAAAPGENPLEHIGQQIPDPWDDDAQEDWDNWIVPGVE